MRRMRHLKPREIQGCQLALDASIPSSLYDATSGGSLVAADGAVARWEDQSGNARHATQGTSGNRPLRRVAPVGGLDAVEFDGSDDRLSYTLTGASAWTIFFALKWLNSSQTSYRGLMSVGNTGATGGSMLLLRTGSLFVGSFGAADLNSTYVPGTTPFTASIRDQNNSTAIFAANGLAAGTTTASNPIAQATNQIGGIAGQYANIQAFQAAAYNVDIGEFVNKRLHCSAMRKWRISG